MFHPYTILAVALAISVTESLIVATSYRVPDRSTFAQLEPIDKETKQPIPGLGGPVFAMSMYLGPQTSKVIEGEVVFVNNMCDMTLSGLKIQENPMKMNVFDKIIATLPHTGCKPGEMYLNALQEGALGIVSLGNQDWSDNEFYMSWHSEWGGECCDIQNLDEVPWGTVSIKGTPGTAGDWLFNELKKPTLIKDPPIIRFSLKKTDQDWSWERDFGWLWGLFHMVIPCYCYRAFEAGHANKKGAKGTHYLALLAAMLKLSLLGFFGAICGNNRDVDAPMIWSTMGMLGFPTLWFYVNLLVAVTMRDDDAEIANEVEEASSGSTGAEEKFADSLANMPGKNEASSNGHSKSLGNGGTVEDKLAKEKLAEKNNADSSITVSPFPDLKPGAPETVGKGSSRKCGKWLLAVLFIFLVIPVDFILCPISASWESSWIGFKFWKYIIISKLLQALVFGIYFAFLCVKQLRLVARESLKWPKSKQTEWQAIIDCGGEEAEEIVRLRDAILKRQNKARWLGWNSFALILYPLWFFLLFKIIPGGSSVQLSFKGLGATCLHLLNLYSTVRLFDTKFSQNDAVVQLASKFEAKFPGKVKIAPFPE